MDQDKLKQYQDELKQIREETKILDGWYWNEEKKKEKRKSLYSYFLENEFQTIQEEFLNNGTPIVSVNDISTWVGWKSKGRRVKRGSKGIKVTSKEPYALTMFNNGSPIIDEKTKRPMVRKVEKWYNFFHIDQTEQSPVK